MADRIQFDPALQELLLRKTGDPLGDFTSEEAAVEELPVVARLVDPAVPVPHLKIVAQIDTIVTGRLPLNQFINVRQHPNIASLKASLEFGLDLAVSVPEIRAAPEALRRINPDGLTGRGVVVGIADWGMDFAHGDFRTSGGRTRILHFWDQRGGQAGQSPAPYGYGREFTRAQIDAALQEPDPYRWLGFDPAQFDRRGTHGAHVASIAAGNGQGSGAPGVAPEADFIFVHLRGNDTRPEDTLGDSVRLLEAVHYIFSRAGDRPVVLNLSLGRTGGEKIGLSPVEQALDAILLERAGRAICMSTGNYYDAQLHSSGRLESGGEARLRWSVTPRNDETAELEVWYSGEDVFGVELVDPFGRTIGQPRLGEADVVRQGGEVIASIYHRRGDPNSGNNQVDIFLWPDAPVGTWTVKLSGEAVRHGGFHAFIERDQPATQSRFDPADSDPHTTIGTICSGFKTISVGAYDARAPGAPLVSFTSAGPTPDGRQVPVISAPGAGIRAARSTTVDLLGRRSMNGVTVKSGSSMAAPHVSGVVALMMEAAGEQRLPAETIRRILIETARPAASRGPDAALRYGAGRVDAAAAVAAVYEWARRETPELEMAVAQEVKEAIPMNENEERTPLHAPAVGEFAGRPLERETNGGTGNFAGPPPDPPVRIPAEHEESYHHPNGRSQFAARTQPPNRETIASDENDAAASGTYTVTDRDARIRTGPPDFAWDRPRRIPHCTRVRVLETSGRYSRVQGVDGTDYGWTATSNLGTFFKDAIRAPLAPARPITIDSSWPARRRALGRTYNRLGGLMTALASALRIELPAVLAVWYVESAGRTHTPGRALIRFENHLLWRRWGRHNPAAYDQHFQHGGRPPATGSACRRAPSDPGSRFGAWKCHQYRVSTADPFRTFHGNQTREYAVLGLATRLAGENTALQCISIGGPQILGSNYSMIGYCTPRGMVDAFQAAEDAHVLGFFDFCQHRLSGGRLIQHLRDRNWREFTRYYNGPGQVARYSARIESAYNEARAVLATLTAGRAAPAEAFAHPPDAETGMGAFRCAPHPAALAAAAHLPQPTSNPAGALTAALRRAGVGDSGIRRFRTHGGFTALEPIAAYFGTDALGELLARLRYTPGQLVDPPHSHGRRLRRNLGQQHTAPLLAARLLLAIPGHFRQLARGTRTPAEAFALENLGWLAMRQLRDAVARSTKMRWWVPAPAPFVTPFASTLPALPHPVRQLILRGLLIDTSLSFGDYQARYRRWEEGLAGRQWRLEAGAASNPLGAGRPFYPALLTIPPPVGVSRQRREINRAWNRYLAAVDREHTPLTEASTSVLRVCTARSHGTIPRGLVGRAALGGLQMVARFPALEGVRIAGRRQVLDAIRPTTEQLFRTIYELGWNDLLFQTSGSFCVRGVKLPRSSPNYHRAARRLSNHGFGLAMDLNVFENPQGRGNTGVMSPRIVAIFEAFHFRWGRCFPTPDPHHFEYCGSTC